MIVVDTHVLLWWALDPEKLSAASKALLNTPKDASVGPWFCASAISVWELGIEIKRGQLEIGTSIEDFATRLNKTGAVELLPVDTTIWLKSLHLEWEHRDPADRVIVATALQKNVPLITKDTIIREFTGVRCIW